MARTGPKKHLGEDLVLDRVNVDVRYRSHAFYASGMLDGDWRIVMLERICMELLFAFEISQLDEFKIITPYD